MKKVIMFTHQKGGVGKSTLSANVSLCLKSEASVAIVDLDHQGSLMSLLGSTPGIKLFGADTSINDIQKMDVDFVLIDTPPYLFHNLKPLASICDLVVVPTKAGILDAIAINSTINTLKEVICKDRILVVLNMVKANTTLTNDIYRQIIKYDVSIAKTRISDLVDFTRSLMTEGTTSKKAQYQINAITKEILNKLI